MSDAPERIWACPDDEGNDREWATDWRPHMGPWVEYVRADISNALVAAAYEAAVDACGDYPRVAPDRDRWEPYDEQIEYSQECIRALTPADAQAALDALVAEKVREALTEAAHLMPRYFGVWSSTGVHIGVWDDGATAASVLGEYPAGKMLDLIDASAILALCDQKEPKR